MYYWIFILIFFKGDSNFPLKISLGVGTYRCIGIGNKINTRYLIYKISYNNINNSFLFIFIYYITIIGKLQKYHYKLLIGIDCSK